VVPILATALTKHHHAVVIWATAEAVFTSIIAFVTGGDTTLRARRVAGLARARWSSCYVYVSYDWFEIEMNRTTIISRIMMCHTIDLRLRE
jgi:hypothetical protein